MLAIQGGRSALLAASRKEKSASNFSPGRNDHSIAAVACAHRNIRVAWALMARGEEYKPRVKSKNSV